MTVAARLPLPVGSTSAGLPDGCARPTAQLCWRVRRSSMPRLSWAGGRLHRGRWVRAQI